MPISLISTQNIDLHEDFENQFKQLIEVVSQHLQKPVLPAPTSIQLAGPSKQAFQVNDKVFAYWWPDEHWYPAHVRQVESEQIYIRFTDGTLQWSKRDQVMLSNLETGDRI